MGGASDTPPTSGSKFFHFHVVFGKKLQNNLNLGVGAPPEKILDPPLDYKIYFDEIEIRTQLIVKSTVSSFSDQDENNNNLSRYWLN